MPSIDSGLLALTKASLITFIGTVILGVFWLLANKDLLGLRTLTNGDRGRRVILGKPVFYAVLRMSHFFIKQVFDLLIVNILPHQHDPVTWTYGKGADKRSGVLWIVSEIIDEEECVDKAIFALGDSAHCREPSNKRTLYIEGLAREALTEVMKAGTSWEQLDTETVRLGLNPHLKDKVGSGIANMYLTDIAPSEASVVTSVVPHFMRSLLNLWRRLFNR